MPFTSTHTVRYVHPDGDDRNDGHSWSSAKKSILSAYDALPWDGGTIYFAPRSLIAPEGDAPQGLWFFGPDETARPGPGWRLHKNLLLSGVGGNNHGSPAINPAADLLGFNPSAPLIWIINTEHPMRFENIAAGEISHGIRLGDRNRPDLGVVHASFYNVQIILGRSEEFGPCVEIGRTCFWLWFDHCYFRGAPGAPWDSDQRAAMLMDGAGHTYISDCLFSDGGLKFYAGREGWNFSINNSTFEVNLDRETYSRYPIHIIGGDDAGFGYIQNVDFADWPTDGPIVPTIKIEGGYPDSIVIVNAYPGFIEGPATVLSRLRQSYQDFERTPAAHGQIGFWKGRISAQHDSARRSFAPVAARFENLAKQNAATWSSLPWPYGPTQLEILPTPISMPDGSQQIGRVRFISDGRADHQGGVTIGLLRGPFTPATSHPAYVIAGVWVREVKPPVSPGERGTAIELTLAETEATFVDGSRNKEVAPPIRGDGEWEWISILSKTAVTDHDTEGWFFFRLRCDGIERVRDFYAPICLVIPEDQISPSEAAEITQHLSTWPDGVAAGAISTLRGQKFIAQGGIGVGNSASVTSDDTELFQQPNIVKKIEVFDANGVSLGFIPVYRE